MSLTARRALVIFVVIAGVTAMVIQSLTGLTGDDLVFLPVGAVLLAVGSVLVLRVPENRVSWLVFVLGGSLAAMGVGEVVFDPAASDALSGIVLFAIFVPGFAVLIPLWFPTGTAPSRRWAWVGSAAAVGVGLILAGQLITAWLEGGDPSSISYCTSVGTCMSMVGVGALLIASAAAIGSFVIRWRRSMGVERLQLRWLVPSFLILGIGFFAEFGGFQESAIAVVFGSAGMLLVPISIGFAITRYHLYDIDRIISRTVTYTVVIGLLALAVALLAAVVGTRFDEPVVVAGTTLGVAALFNPLRIRVQRAVDRRFNRSRYDVERVMDEFAGSLRDRVDSDDVVYGWLGVVTDTMQPATASVWLRDR